MKSKFFIGTHPQTNNNHAVHKEGCPFLPEAKKRIFLGEFNSGHEAAREGQKIFVRTQCCIFCTKEAVKRRETFVFPKQEFVELDVHHSIKSIGKFHCYTN